MTTIVFSKDRAMQLQAFLRSYRDHVKPPQEIHVLYADSSLRHHEAYGFVFEGYRWALPHFQADRFKDELLDLLPETGNVVFFVDDQVFTRHWAVLERSGLSLRLGRNLTRNYNSSDAPQPLPAFEEDGDLLTWRWADGVMAWGYPLSLDGHVFVVEELREMLSVLPFTSPNTLEAALQAYTPRYLPRRGACYAEAKVVNVPWNLVQTDWKNRYAGSNGDCRMAASAEEMLAHWEAGLQIDLSGIYGVLNESVHQEFPLALESR